MPASDCSSLGTIIFVALPSAAFAKASIPFSDSTLSRGFMFMAVGILFRLFGAPIKAFIDKYLIWVTGAFVVALVGGFVAVAMLSGGTSKVADQCSNATMESITAGL